MSSEADKVIQDVLRGDGGRACNACIHVEREQALARALRILLPDLDAADPRRTRIDQLFANVKTVTTAR